MGPKLDLVNNLSSLLFLLAVLFSSTLFCISPSFVFFIPFFLTLFLQFLFNDASCFWFACGCCKVDLFCCWHFCCPVCCFVSLNTKVWWYPKKCTLQTLPPTYMESRLKYIFIYMCEIMLMFYLSTLFIDTKNLKLFELF